MSAFPKAMGATFSPDRKRRFALWRVWNREAGLMLWVMCNPSTAGEARDDPTIRRIADFTKRAKYGGFVVANLITQVTAHPIYLRAEPEPPEADQALRDAIAACGLRVAAWGVPSVRTPEVWALFQEREKFAVELCGEMLCLGTTRSGGHPRHPVRLPKATKFERYYR